MRYIFSLQRSSQANALNRQANNVCAVVERRTDVVRVEEGGALSAGPIQATEKAMPGCWRMNRSSTSRSIRDKVLLPEDPLPLFPLIPTSVSQEDLGYGGGTREDRVAEGFYLEMEGIASYWKEQVKGAGSDE